MGEAFSAITNAFISVFSEGTLFIRLATLAFIILLGLWFESYSGFGFNLRMNHQLNLLATLNELTDAPIEKEEDLEEIRDILVNKLNRYAQRETGLTYLSTILTLRRFWGFFWAFLPWLVIVIMMYASSVKEGNFGGFYLALILGLVLGIAGSFVSTLTPANWIHAFNAIVLGVVPITTVVVTGIRINRNKTPPMG